MASERVAIGAELAEARRSSGRSLRYFAAVTDLSEEDLAALEVGEFEAVGSPVRAKAAVRVYGNAVQVDAEALLRRLENGQPPRELPPLVPGPAGWPPGPPGVPGRWVGLALVGLVVGIGIAWLLSALGAERGSVQVRPAPAATGSPGKAAEGDGASVGIGSRGSVSGDVPLVAGGENEPPAAERTARESGATDRGPEPRQEGSPRDAPTHVTPPAEMVVQVLDGSYRDGVLARAAGRIRDHGYTVGYTDVTASPMRQSVVFYRPGFKAEAKVFRRTIADVARLERNTDLTADADLHVVVGQDWSDILHR